MTHLIQRWRDLRQTWREWRAGRWYRKKGILTINRTWKLWDGAYYDVNLVNAELAIAMDKLLAETRRRYKLKENWKPKEFSRQ